MSVIQEKINAIAPDAVYVEAQYPTFTIPQDKMRQVARTLHDDADLSFDYLVCLTGVDEGPEKAKMRAREEAIAAMIPGMRRQ